MSTQEKPAVDENAAPCSSLDVTDDKAVKLLDADEEQAVEHITKDVVAEAEKVKVKVQFGHDCYDVSVCLSASVKELQEKVFECTGVPPLLQKLFSPKTGQMKTEQTLADCKLTDGCKVKLIGSAMTDIASANSKPTPEQLRREQETAATKKEPLCTQKPHVTVLEKGVPDDSMPGIRNVKEGLPQLPIKGLRNDKGQSVRLTFKLELDQLWIGTVERTLKVPLGQITDVISEPIVGHEEYHMMGLKLGTTEASRKWFYWVPAQYVDAIRKAILD